MERSGPTPFSRQLLSAGPAGGRPAAGRLLLLRNCCRAAAGHAYAPACTGLPSTPLAAALYNIN